MTDNDETLDRLPRPHFDSTQWSLVLAAQHRSSPDGRLAFAQLCEKYWYPLYAFVRQSESDIHRARDLTQGFFEQVIEKNYIADADPNRGRFRTFLLTSLSNFVANEWNKSQAVKRGGGKTHLSLDFARGDQFLQKELASAETPESLYQRHWALTVLHEVLEQLRVAHESAGKSQLFEELKQFLLPGAPETYAAIAERLNMGEGAVRVAVHRLRTRYREALREEIANTLSNPADVDDEIRSLFNAFSR